MPGMPCWTGAFANAAGRASIEAEIKGLEESMVAAKELYDSLSAEQEREAGEERAIALADSMNAEAKLSNEILNSKKREANITAALAAATAGSTEYTEAQTALAAAQAKTAELE